MLALQLLHLRQVVGPLLLFGLGKLGLQFLDLSAQGCGYDDETVPETAQARVGSAILFAIETAMRAGEICALRLGDIDQEKRVAYVRAEQKGARKTRQPRAVPLSTYALEIVSLLPKSDALFGITASSLDALFRKAKKRALIEDLHFHDFRHEATSRLAKVFTVMELARITGHRDLRMLMVYYNPTAEELAGKLG